VPTTPPAARAAALAAAAALQGAGLGQGQGPGQGPGEGGPLSPRSAEAARLSANDTAFMLLPHVAMPAADMLDLHQKAR
jgi:hypothetical protein